MSRKKQQQKLYISQARRPIYICAQAIPETGRNLSNCKHIMNRTQHCKQILNENDENVDNADIYIETTASFCYIGIVFDVDISIFPQPYQQLVDNFVNIFPLDGYGTPLFHEEM